jgi:magnesium transporter
MREMYLSGLSNRMNEVMKVLTIIATIFIPLTFIAGIYGMNFAYMPELQWYYGYPAAVFVMVAIAALMVVYFRHKRWI